MAEAEEAAEAGEEEGTGEVEGSGDGSAGVVFLDPELEEDARAGLEEALGCEVRVLSPAELPPSFPGVADHAIIVPFSLPDQCGLDLVETLRLRELGREVAIAVADEQPTRSRVFAALRVGASSVARKPYDADELKQRLAPALEAMEAEDPEGATDDDPEEASDDVSE